MNKKLKKKILETLEESLEEQKQEKNFNVKCQNIFDISNLVKIIENYEELEPKLAKILNEKARLDKWR